MNRKTYVAAAKGSAGVAEETLLAAPAATNAAAVAAITMTTAASATLVADTEFIMPKKFAPSGKENQAISGGPTYHCNNNAYGALEDHDLVEYGDYPSSWITTVPVSGKKSEHKKRKPDTSSVGAAKKKPHRAALGRNLTLIGQVTEWNNKRLTRMSSFESDDDDDDEEDVVTENVDKDHQQPST